MSKLLDIVTGPWAIIPAKLVEIQGIYATHLRSDKIDIKGVEAALGRPLNNVQQGYEVVDGVAVIQVQGVIGKRMNLFTQISGGASTELIGRDVKAALADSSVDSILLYIDSPGGSVDGTQTLADIIMQASAQKPVVAFADGMMASAAYWIGSAASQIVAADGTTQIGSIGVVASHTDISGMETQRGIKTTEITAGKYKRIASQYGPLSGEGAASIQQQVDGIYTLFVNDVAAQRGATPEKVIADMADGRVFLAQDALQAGLIDRIASFDAVLAEMAAGILPPLRKAEGGVPAAIARNATGGVPEAEAQPQLAAGAVAETQPSVEGEDMDIKTLREKHPDIAQALVAEGHAAGMQAGAEAERKRIQDVEAQGMPGHEKLIASLKFDGKTTGPEAAVQVLNAERGKGAAHAAALAAEAPQAAAAVAAPAAAAPAADGGELTEEKLKANWEASADLRAEFGAFETYSAFMKAEAAGRVKVLGKK